MKAMKTLIFNGSPRKNGDTQAMINYLQDHLEGEVQVFDAYHSLIKGCVDCRYCWTHPRCAFSDFLEMDNLIREADNIVIASPIYFNEVTGDLLRMLSKVQIYWSANYLRQEQIIDKPKRGGLVIAYAGNCNLKYPEHTCRILLKNMRVEAIHPTVYADNTDHIPAKSDEKALAMLDDLAAFFNEER